MTRLLRHILFVLVSLSAPLSATTVGRDMAREKEIETALTKKDPAMLEPFRSARIAYDAGNYAEAERLLRTVLQHTPDFDPAVRRLGGALEQLGKHGEAIRYAQKAVALDRSSANLVTLAGILAFPKQGEPSSDDQELALSMLIECRRLPHGDDLDILIRTAQLCLQMEKKNEAREAIATLEEKYPDQMPTHYFAAVIAAVDEHWMKADREIREAQKLGLPEDSVRKFLDSGVESRAKGWRIAASAGIAIGAWALGLLTLFVVGAFLSKATLRQANTADVALPVSPGEHRLRRIYRFVLNAAGVYYYVSLPVVLVLLIGVSLLILYACLAFGFIAIKLIIIVGIGALITIWSMIRSLFLRLNSVDPGRPLERSEAEGLWKLTEEVAAAMNTRPIDEIRLTVGTELAVYEKGSWREKLDNKAKRILILGTAVLNGFKQDDFRCVLAHEYGHFSNRDTAGGDIAMRVENDMLKFYRKMYEAGQATNLNVAFQFLRIYQFIFRRISHGATRLQEILADRVAAQTYGAAAFEGGLRHVIGQSIAFGSHANREIEEAIKTRRPISNLYEAPETDSASIREQFEKALNRPTTNDDTHPGPMERFRLIAKIPAPVRQPSEGFVWELFRDREAIISEMTAKVEENVAPHRPHF